jgi:hypothetical protein
MATFRFNYSVCGLPISVFASSRHEALAKAIYIYGEKTITLYGISGDETPKKSRTVPIKKQTTLESIEEVVAWETLKDESTEKAV